MVIIVAFVIIAISGCTYTPAGRERAHVEEILSGMKALQAISMGCGGAILANDSLCADVVTGEGKKLRFEYVGFKSFGPNAANVFVGEADGWVPRIATCDSVGEPNFHRDAPLGHHFQPTLIDVKDAITRSGEVLEEIQFWPQCPQSWEVQDKQGINYRYCVRRKDATDDPPRPVECGQRDR